MKISVRYFAVLRDERGLAKETLESSAPDPLRVYEALATQHGFSLGASQVRFAVNGQYVDSSQALRDGDELVFVPPVAGG
jgi:molybdopterin synthase sulfur carrier subunit